MGLSSKNIGMINSGSKYWVLGFYVYWKKIIFSKGLTSIYAYDKINIVLKNICGCGGIGRRTRLRI